MKVNFCCWQGKNVFIKLLSFILSLCVLLAVFPMVFTAAADAEIWNGSVAAAYNGGSGTSDDPYIINNASQLAYLGSILNSGSGTAYIGKAFKLTADIYLNDISDYDSWDDTVGSKNVWDSAGNPNRAFGGTFDGNGHTIYGLYVSGNVNTGTGLFGAVSNATIKNLSIDKAYVSGTTFIGGIVGIARGNTTIEKCSFSGKINASGNFSGGLVGKYEITNNTNLNINSSFTKGEFTASGVIIGGFIGDFVSNTTYTVGISINNSYCAANINGNDYRTAGFIGRATNGGNETGKSVTIRRSHFSGTLSSNATGTLVGMDASHITITTDTYYNATVIGGAANKTLVYGTAKSSAEFSDGTLTQLLNTAAKDAGDSQSWEQGSSYPTHTAIWDGTAAADYVGGSGTEDDPYLIGNAAQLKYFANKVNGNDVGYTRIYRDKYIKLIADIYLNDISDYNSWTSSAPANEWKSIGLYNGAYNQLISFAGTFDGNGHTIYGLYTNVEGSSNYGAGLFACVYGATIKNLNISYAYIVSNSSQRAGGVVGVTMESADLENVTFNGSLISSSSYVFGGLVGLSAGNGTVNISNCSTTGTARAAGIAGGLIATIEGVATVNIVNSYSTMNISKYSGTGSDRFGGLVGRLNNASATVNAKRCYFAGTLASGGSNYGGLVGQRVNGTVNAHDIYYNSDLMSNSPTAFENVTGYSTAAFSDGTITNLLNSAAIAAEDNQMWMQGSSYPVFANVFYRGHSLVLDARIGVNFFMDLSGLNESEKETTYMTFSVDGSAEEKRAFFNGDFTDQGGHGYYGFVCKLSSVQMADEITPTFHYTVDGIEQTLVGYTYSAKNYIDYVFSNEASYGDSVVNLVRALGNYGYYAQQNFGKKTFTALSTDYRTVEDYSSSYETKKESLSSYAHTKSDTYVYNLNFDSQTILLIRYNETLNVTFNSVVSGEDAYTNKYTRYNGAVNPNFVELQLPLPVLWLAGKFTVEGVKEGTPFIITDISAFSYIYGILDKSSNTNLKNMLCALYDYYLKAYEYQYGMDPQLDAEWQ